MTIFANRIGQWIGYLSIALAVGMTTGCDDSEFDRDPPSGQGSLIADNFTGDRIAVYLDGLEAESVRSGKHRYYDLDPGVHRIALDSDDTRRSWAGDVDILEGRRTVLEVRGYQGDYNSFDVEIYFD